MQLALTILVYVVVGFVAILQALILWKIWDNKIDLTYLIAGEDGDASLSRFQFLLFTFVVVVATLYLTIKGGEFPEINQGVLTLLGISGASYALGKSLDKPQGEDQEAENSQGGDAGGSKPVPGQTSGKVT